MKILAVCGFGVGSSMVLKMTIEKALRQLEVSAEVENTDIMTAKSATCDLIFTSPSLKSELETAVACEVIAIEKYVDVEEVKTKLKSQI